MTRSIWKGPFTPHCVKRKIDKVTDPKKAVIKIYQRNTIILPSYIGMKLLVHNGRAFISVFVTPEKVGRKVGEFSFTRVKPKHNLDKQQNRKAPSAKKTANKK